MVSKLLYIFLFCFQTISYTNEFENYTIKDLKELIVEDPSIVNADGSLCLSPAVLKKLDKKRLKSAEAFFDLGKHQESLDLSLRLLVSSLSFWDRGKNYILMARNYEALKNVFRAKYYYQRALNRNSQYYFYLYARFEENQKNYRSSIEYYQKALSHKSGEKEYIVNSYQKMIYKALIYFKKRNFEYYRELLQEIKNDPRFSQRKIRVIEKSLVL